MRTRGGLCYPRVLTTMYSDLCSDLKVFAKRNNSHTDIHSSFLRRKRRKKSPENSSGDRCFFDSLHDDLILLILSKLSSSASSPSDFINLLTTCKRFNELGLNSSVLSTASSKCLAVKAKNWSQSAHRFLKLCIDAGNIEACYTLGMIRFYCLQNRGSGASLLAKAAINSHAPALYSLAVIQFNGSGGTKNDKHLRAGVALCARAAFLGHIDALRELGHCLQDGYGIRQNIIEGRRFLVQANARELAAVLASSAPPGSPTRSLLPWSHFHQLTQPHQQQHGGNHRHQFHHLHSLAGSNCPLLSDFGCNVPAPEAHPANRFLTEWFSGGRVAGLIGSGLRLCSHVGCGRPETRRHEFRRCSVCGTVNYCSRACQALDWKLRHKVECTPVDRWVDDDEGDDIDIDIDIDDLEVDGGVDGNGDVEMVEAS